MSGAFVGTEECGCVSLLITDRPEVVKDAEREIRALKRRKGTLTPMPIEDARKVAWRCPGHEMIYQAKLARDAEKAQVAK